MKTLQDFKDSGADLVLSLDFELGCSIVLLRLRVHYSVEIKPYES